MSLWHFRHRVGRVNEGHGRLLNGALGSRLDHPNIQLIKPISRTSFRGSEQSIWHPIRVRRKGRYNQKRRLLFRDLGAKFENDRMNRSVAGIAQFRGMSIDGDVTASRRIQPPLRLSQRSVQSPPRPVAPGRRSSFHLRILREKRTTARTSTNYFRRKDCEAQTQPISSVSYDKIRFPPG
jgi:hypothetical protein